MELIKHPNVFLKQETHEVEFPLDNSNVDLIHNMKTIMYDNNGIGLAANQVGYNRRIFVMDVSNERDNAQVFINPVIKSKNNSNLPVLIMINHPLTKSIQGKLGKLVKMAGASILFSPVQAGEFNRKIKTLIERN